MRTSPLGMRRPRRRAPLVLLSLALVAALGAACSDDGDDEGANPTTTSPTTTEADDGDDGTTTAPPDGTTTSAATDTTEPGAVPGDDADVLTPEQAQAQLEALVAEYRQAVAEAATTQALDEATLAGFSEAFTGRKAQAELQALQEAGVEILNPTPPEITVADVEITAGTPGCAAGTATIEGISGFVTTPVETIQPYYFRLVPAPEGAAAPAWRLDFLNFTNNDQPPSEASCT
jgi:hypothetical protein